MRSFNSERYIGEAIESVLGQVFRDFELVIVDDSSSDGTAAILETYSRRDGRVRVIRNETNQGAVRTMNIALRHARGEFVAINDADDISLPHRLQIQADFLRTNPQVALVGGAKYIIDEEGEVIQLVNWGRMGPEQTRQHLAEGKRLAHSSVMFRRKCIESIGLYDEFFRYAHDRDMLIRMAAAYGVVYYGEPIIKWRWLNTGITGRQNKAQAAFSQLARARGRAKETGTSLDLQQEYNRLMGGEAAVDGTNDEKRAYDADYYYTVGVLLLDRGKARKARQRFLRSLKCSRSIKRSLEALVFYVISFFPKGANSWLVRAARKSF